MEVNTISPTQETGPYNEQDQQVLEGKEPIGEQQPQEELIGGKFKSADDLLQAYQELEKKLGSDTSDEETQEASEESTEETDVSVLSTEEEKVILESVGGQEKYDQIQDWARTALDGDELEAFNREVNSGDYYRARNALQSLTFAYNENAGVEPELVSGKLSARSTDVYRSPEEVVTAMSDSRYLQDPAYTKDVEEKLNRSNVLTPT